MDSCLPTISIGSSAAMASLFNEDEQIPTSTNIKSLIKVIAYETSDPGVYAVVIKSEQQTVTKNNTCLHILPDTSGSMQVSMGGAIYSDPFTGNPSGNPPVNAHFNMSAQTPIAASYGPSNSLAPSVVDSTDSTDLTDPLNPSVLHDQDEQDVQDAQDMRPPPLTRLAPSMTIAYNAPYATSATYATLPSLQRSYSSGPYSTSASQNDMYDNTPIDPQSRLGAEEAFIDRILDMLKFIEEEQGVKQHITISPFSDQCKSFSTLDGLTYEQIRKDVKQALRVNSGTNFDEALKEVDKCRTKFALQTDGTGTVIAVLLSDGGHCGGTKTAQQVEADYSKSVEMAIGIGRGQQDFNEQTLRAISKKFLATNDAKVMRDEVAMLAMNLVTNLGKNITLKTIGDESHIFYSNMSFAEDEDGNRVCKAANMSMLMEYYALVTKDTVLELSYTLQNGEFVNEVIHFSEENNNLFGDTSYGDQIKFTLETLEQSEKIHKEIADMSNPQSKLTYVKEFKDRVKSSPHAQAFIGTRVGVYLQHLLFQLDQISLTKDDQALLQMAKNVGADAFRNTSSDSATAYCSPAASIGLSPMCSDSAGTPSAPQMLRATNSTSATYGSMCLICMDPSAHRGAIYNPCGHFRTCNECTLEWNKTSDKCPYCNGVSNGIILVNLSDEQKKDSWNLKCTTCKKRQIEVVAEDCKHVFSCKPCMSLQNAQKRKVSCTVCEKEGKDTQVTKYKKIFM